MILIDTHVLIWWINGDTKLSKIAEKAINSEKENGYILVSSISVWEIYLLVRKNRFRLTLDIDSWFERIEKLPYLQFVPISNRIASKSVTLPGDFHNDPADRMIVATAREKGTPLITSDEKIRHYPHVKTLW